MRKREGPREELSKRHKTQEGGPETSIERSCHILVHELVVFGSYNLKKYAWVREINLKSYRGMKGLSSALPFVAEQSLPSPQMNLTRSRASLTSCRESDHILSNCIHYRHWPVRE